MVVELLHPAMGLDQAPAAEVSRLSDQDCYRWRERK